MFDNQDPTAQAVDTSISDAFPAPVDGGSQPTTAPTEEPTSAAPAQPAPFELRTSTGTIYKSPEEAQRGIEHKDTLIQQLRQGYIQQLGYDPLNPNQPQQQHFRQQPQSAPQPQGYAANPKQYAIDLQQAAVYGQQTGDYGRYFEVQQKAIDERASTLLQEYLAPYQGLVQGMAKSQALQAVSSSNPQFQTFYGSSDYNSVLQSQPLLADAISQAEVNPQFADKLPGLYSLVHQLSQAAKVAETVRQTQSANPSPTPVRPTASAATMAPPNSGSPADPNAWRSDPEARKQLIQQMEAKYGIRSR